MKSQKSTMIINMSPHHPTKILTKEEKELRKKFHFQVYIKLKEEQRSRTDPLRTSIRKKTRFIDTEHYKKATIVQARIKGVLLRKKFRLKLKRYVFVKSLINYIRRFNRKVIIKPIFRNLRDKYACYYLLRMLSPKLEGPIRRIKLKMANKIFRSKKIREIIQRQRMKLKVAGWIPLRVKNLTPEQLTDVKSTYAIRVI